MKEKIIIRQASLLDIETLIAFQKAMAWETENLLLDVNVLRKGVRKILKNKHIGCYYVATLNNDLAACMMLLYEWSDWRNAQVVWIHSVYVLPEHRKKGVFKDMYLYLKNKVKRQQTLAGLRLYVDKKNTNAQKVYTYLGMNNAHYELFEWLK